MSMLSAKNKVIPLGARSTGAISGIIGQIGHTPLLELKRIGADVAPVKILAKAEWFNPGGSVKDRAALNMILDGERSGQLTADKTILDLSNIVISSTNKKSTALMRICILCVVTH